VTLPRERLFGESDECACLASRGDELLAGDVFEAVLRLVFESE
jgi:hypothetical protein